VVLAATNAPWDIDPALRRAGRLSEQVLIPPPDLESRKKILELHCRKFPTQGIDFEEIGRRCEGYSSADLKQLCDESAKSAWRRAMQSKQKIPVSMEDFKNALNIVSSSLDPWFIQARNELEKSEEGNAYPKLAQLLASQSTQKSEVDDLKQAEAEKIHFEVQLERIKQKLRDGELDENAAKELVLKCQHKLVEIEAKIKILSERNS
jgi:SpoVK/Ycf46/Vps4 family AAA+-type ATPase